MVRYARINTSQIHDQIKRHIHIDGVTTVLRQGGTTLNEPRQTDDSESHTQHRVTSSKSLTVVKRVTKNNDSASRIVKQDSLTYVEFNITLPNFITEFGKHLFFLDERNNEKSGLQTKEKLNGEIYTIRRGTFSMPYDCGYKSNVSFVLNPRIVPSTRWYRSLVPMMVPDGGTFQHFLDGTLPKIIQALDYIQQPQVMLLMPPIRDQIIFEILQKLNISRNKIVTYSGSAGADYLVFTCITPPLHPYLWQRARSLIGVSNGHVAIPNRNKIAIVTREGCHNCGRLLLNKGALIETLRNKYSKENVQVYTGPFDLEKTIQFFSKVKVVIGTHGGGLYNINFCPSNTTVIEIMPTYDDGKTLAAAHQIIWTQSVLLEHKYWRLPTVPENDKGNVNINVTQVLDILEQTLDSNN